MNKLLSLITFLSLTVSTFGQTTITGRVVTKEDNEGLPGAVVQIKGTQTGTVTNLDGDYSIAIEDEEIVLIFSSVGYKKVEVPVGTQSQIDVELEVLVSELDELVVIGYGNQEKRKIISSITTLDTKELQKMPVAKVSDGLEGLAAGLFVRQTSGEPGFSNTSYEVRNFGNALVIVDGSPGNMDELDPNEIESVTVLKDAAATAVYGVRGGNGIIVVKTRRGTQGKPKLTYSNQFSFNSFTTYPEFLNSGQYATVYNQSLINAGKEAKYSEEEIEKFRSGSDPVNYPNVNWRDIMFKDYSQQSRHNLNLEGGNEDVKYFISAGFIDQGSNYNSDVLGYNQYNIRANVDAVVAKNLNLELTLAGRRRLFEAPAYSAYDIFRELSRALPTNLAYYPDGTPAKPQFSPNHIAEGIKDFNAGYYRARNNNIDAKLSLEWQTPVKGLSVKSYASMIYNNYFQKEWDKSYDLYTLNRSTGDYRTVKATPEGTPSETVLKLSTNYENDVIFQQSVNYENSFGNHNVSGVMVGEIQHRSGENFTGSRQDFQSTYIDQLFAGSNENKDANGGQFVITRAGLVGRFSYDYKEKYFLESSFRYDGTSRFASGHQGGFFPGHLRVNF